MTLKFEKPGKKQKSSKIKNKSARLHDIKTPDDKRCRGCNIETGTESYRHIEVASWKYAYGKGTGQKCDDRLTAWLCNKCDHIYSTKPDKSASQYDHDIHELTWLTAIIKTHLL